MTPKERKVPLRTCVACRAVRPKRDLVRVVRTPDGAVRIDPTGKMSGRGASLCPRSECFEAATKTGALARSLQVGLDTQQIERLRVEFARLPAKGEGTARGT